MSMRWDTLLTRHVAAELGRSLRGARLRAVRLDRSERDLALLFEERTLLWRLHPRRGYLLLGPGVVPGEGDHRLEGRLSDVHSPPDERLVRFDFSGRPGRFSIIVELMSTQWNAAVTEGDADLVRHLLWRPSGDVRRVTGQSYAPPSPTEREGAEGAVELEDWLAVLEPLAPEKRKGVLLRRFAWSSPVNAGALLGEAPAAGQEAGLALGYERWKAMARGDAPTEPVILQLDYGAQPYPFPLPGTTSRPAETLLAAFEACAAEQGDSGEASATVLLGPDLLARLERSLVHATRREHRLDEELATLPVPREMRTVGDLILARYHEIPAGATEATLTGFDGEPVRVRLEPGEPAHESAARYYRSASKAERAAARLPGLLEEARREREALEALLERVRQGEASEAEVREALGPERAPSAGEVAGPALPYRSFRSSGGLEIRVGKGARFNDDLTFHHSAPGDVWLHARHTAGAHVILRWSGPGRPPARDLNEAAILAALHSKARTSGSVPVDWTLRKYVRKPRKSPPGQVVIEREETLFVEPDESLLESLAERRGFI
jgi:predicted ribosome quality control (RQC) complex YloA/Tae2 family protein